jgi:tRNA pseudouridine38-40 synthase
MTLRVAVKIAYIGGDFCGSQIQPNVRTVEGVILSDLQAICHMTPEELDVRMASRTDSGVNALGNVVVFNTDFDDFVVLLKALNAVSKGVFYRSIAIVRKDFNPRIADRRLYRYIIPGDGMDFERARTCARLFQGEHDFQRFCRTEGRPTEATIDSIDLWRDGDVIIADFSAVFYLWNMIRRIMAAVISVGKGWIKIEDVHRALEGADVTFGLARPDALTLMDVIYCNIDFIVPSDSMFDSRIEESVFQNKIRAAFFASL